MLLVKIWQILDKSDDPLFLSLRGYHEWDDNLLGITGVSTQIEAPHGGGVVTNYGTLSVKTRTFETSPPALIYFDVYYVVDEDFSVLLSIFTGTGALKNVSYSVTEYSMFADIPNVQTDISLWNNSNPALNTLTLEGAFILFRDAVNSIDPVGDWTLDSTYADSDLRVYFEVTDDIVHYTLMSELCKAMHHWFYLDPVAKTIHLIDMEKPYGTIPDDHILDESEFFPLNYPYPIPLSYVEVGIERHYNNITDHSPAPFGGNVTMASYSGDYVPPAVPIVQPPQDETVAHFILSTYTLPDVELRIPMRYFMDRQLIIGDVLQWTDTRLPVTVTCTMKIRKIRYIFSSKVSMDKAVLIGDTEIV